MSPRVLLPVVALLGCTGLLRSSVPLPAVAPPPAEVRLCTPKHPPRALPPNIQRFELAPEDLLPLSYGPRVAEMPLRTAAVPEADVSVALFAWRDVLRRCYRWARYGHRALQGDVRVELLLSPLGVVETLRATPADPEGAALAGCVEAVLRDLQVYAYGGQLTALTALLRFQPSRQGVPAAPPAHPQLPTAPPLLPAGTCRGMPAALPIAQLRLPTPAVLVDDYDAAQEAAEYQARRRAWERNPRLPLRGYAPEVVLGLPEVHCRLDQPSLLTSLHYNIGAYRACYRQALERHPGLAGTLLLSGRIGALGQVDAAKVMSMPLADPALAACMEDALAQVRLDPRLVVCQERGAASEFVYPLRLRPLPQPDDAAASPYDTVEHIEARAARQLDRGDFAAAQQSFAALLQQRPQHPRACLFHLGAARAALGRWPWQDERTEAALAALLAALRAPGQPPAACREQALPLLMALATAAHRRAQRWHAGAPLIEAETRYAQLLSLTPPPALEVRALYYLGEALWRRDQRCAAAPRYDAVARHPAAGRLRRDAAYAAVLSWKDCLHDTPETDPAYRLIIQRLQESFHAFQELTEKEAAPDGR